MPRVFNQKIKILYLMRIFLEQTDEEHPMSVKELIAYLNSLGISAERKTVYDDIETLRNFGMDILNRREHPTSGGCSTVLQMYHQWEIPTADQEAGEPCQCL